jgi:hypothetical protein
MPANVKWQIERAEGVTARDERRETRGHAAAWSEAEAYDVIYLVLHQRVIIRSIPICMQKLRRASHYQGLQQSSIAQATTATVWLQVDKNHLNKLGRLQATNSCDLDPLEKLELDILHAAIQHGQH